MGRPRKPIAHGTPQGYRQEIYRDIETCWKCRKAWREYCYRQREKRNAG